MSYIINKYADDFGLQGEKGPAASGEGNIGQEEETPNEVYDDTVTDGESDTPGKDNLVINKMAKLIEQLNKEGKHLAADIVKAGLSDIIKILENSDAIIVKE